MKFEIEDKALFINGKKLNLINLSFSEEIGNGANSKVFLAYNNLLDRQEAIKIWVNRKCQETVDEDRFLEEVRKNANVNFSNVANFYDANIENGLYYARLEYIPGHTLNVFLQEEHEFSIRYIILKTILETMLSVYGAGFYHGDLHSANIIVNEYKPYIIDFGTSFFSGVTMSHERDCRMLVELCFEVLPELRNLEFIDNTIVIEQGSLLAAEFLQRCLLIVWDFQNTPSLALDSYTYKEWRLRFNQLIESYPFVDIVTINKFFAENYSKKTNN